MSTRTTPMASKLSAAFALTAVALSAAAPARAQVARLSELEQRALGTRASLVAQRARSAGAAARVSLAGAPMRPTLTANAEAEASPGGRLIHVTDVSGADYLVSGARTLGSSGALTPQERYGVTVSLASRLWDFGRTKSEIRAAEEDRGAALASEHAESNAIVLQVRLAYFAWLLADGTRDILLKNVQGATALRQSVAGRVAEGTRPGADLSSVLYDEARAALELSRAEGDVASARLALARAVGAQLPANAEPEFALLDSPASRNPNGAPSEPRVVALERQRDAALANARAHGLWRVPVLSGLAETGLRGQSSQVFPVYRLGVSLSVPLFDGGVESDAEAVASARADELSALTREARELAALDRVEALSDLDASEQRLRLALVLSTFADTALRQAQEARGLGAGAAEAVIQARIKSADSKLEVLSARVARAQAQLRLYGPAPLGK